MRVLAACEYSGVVRNAFLETGHDAWSCDIRPGDSDRHIQGDVLSIVNDGWDLVVGFPPCTHLAGSGARWWPEKLDQQADAVEFVYRIKDADCPLIAIENPVGILSTVWRKPDQIVHPWWFGDEFSKRTCLWLKGLPELVATEVVGHGEVVVHGGRRIPRWYSNRERPRDRTFDGIAAAMALQWGQIENPSE